MRQGDRSATLENATGSGVCLFHWGALTDHGLRVTDVWETKEQFEQYAQEKIGPYSQQVGIPGPPRVTFYDEHNYQAAFVLTK